MGRRRNPREHMTCLSCGRVGTTARSRARLLVFGLSSTTVAILIGLELTGVTQLGDVVWSVAITILLASIGLRLLIRGDRCTACGGPARYVKR